MKGFISFLTLSLVSLTAFAKIHCEVLRTVCQSTVSVVCDNTGRVGYLDTAQPGLMVDRFKLGYQIKGVDGRWFNGRTCGTVKHPDGALVSESFRILDNPRVNLAVLNGQLGSLRKTNPESRSLRVLKAIDHSWYCPTRRYYENLESHRVAITSLDLESPSLVTGVPTCH